jgi:hypothetical protein
MVAFGTKQVAEKASIGKGKCPKSGRAQGKKRMNKVLHKFQL